MDLPIEIINVILSNLDFNGLLKMRLISVHWRGVVEGILSRKIKSLAIITPGFMECHSRCPTVNDRFFGALKVEDFTRITVTNHSSTVLSDDRTKAILKLFPNVENFVYSTTLNSIDIINLLLLMHKWENISTFAFASPIEPEHESIISAAINGLKKLTRLELRQDFNISLLGPTLARIHHLSVGFKLLPEVIREIGPECRRLWVEEKYSTLNVSDLQSWMEVNARFCRSLTHFCCSLGVGKDTKAFLDQHFTSLRVWYTLGTDFLGISYKVDHNIIISRLNELHILHVKSCVLSQLIGSDANNGMENNIHIFEFRDNCYCEHSNNEVNMFFQKLSWLLPNVEDIKITFLNSHMIELFEKKVCLFKKLKKYELSVYYPN